MIYERWRTSKLRARNTTALACCASDLLVDNTGHRLGNIWSIFVLPVIASAAAFGVAWGGSTLAWVPQTPLFAIGVISLIGWPLVLLLLRLSAPDVPEQLIVIARTVIVRRAR